MTYESLQIFAMVVLVYENRYRYVPRYGTHQIF
jgi:hypothetical protein